MERERVMPYRPFIHYNSWYELNINRNNDSDPAKRMTEEQCLAVLKDWQEQFFQKRGMSIDAFVWDNGWDEFNSLWDFHKMFPQGFKRIDAAAGRQKAGIGTWLGPVGGYGASKGKRLAYWNVKHPDNKIGNFQLSNKEYFDAFVGRCSQMVKDYNMKYSQIRRHQYPLPCQGARQRRGCGRHHPRAERPAQEKGGSLHQLHCRNLGIPLLVPLCGFRMEAGE